MRTWRKHLVILILYTIVALVMTLPLALHFFTTIPGVEGDAPSFVWAMGWMKTALERGINPFRSDFVFYPLGGATQLLWATSLIGFVSIPFQSVFGLVATHNLFYLAATVLTAYGTYLLAEEVLRFRVVDQKPKFDLTPLPPFQTLLVARFVLEQRRLASRVSPLACFVAGLVFAFAPLRLGYGLAFFNLYNTQLIPFYVLFLLRAMRDQSRRDAMVAGMLLGLNAYIDFQIAAFLILFTGFYAAYEWLVQLNRLVESKTFPARLVASFRVAATPVLLSGLVSLLVAAPMLTIVANDFATEGGNYIRVFPIKYSTDRSYDLLSYFVPNAWSTIYSGVPKIPGVNAGVDAKDGSALSPDRQAFVGYIILVLAACATITQWRRARFWFFIAIAFAVPSLGPYLHIFDANTNIPLPYLVLHEIPIVNHIRIPMRYGIIVAFALALLAAISIDGLLKRAMNHTSRIPPLILRIAILLVPFFVLLEYANLPFPVQPLSIPRIYSDIAQQPGNFTVLEIPSFNWRYAATTEVFQAIHGKRILRAYTNRIAPELAAYVGSRGTPIIVRSLRLLEGAEQGVLEPDEIAEDKRVRDEVVRFFDLRYAVVHHDYLKPAQITAIDAYLRDVLKARIVSTEGDTMLYEIPPAPPASNGLVIDLRENIAQMYAGRGWHFQFPPANFDSSFNFVWASGATSEIYFVAAGAADRVITINAFTEEPQRVSILLNGDRVGEIDLPKEWRDYRVALPGRLIRAGMNRIELQYVKDQIDIVGVTKITIE